MAMLQKFKLLAMQCGASKSPTRSPRTSPMVQLWRRKTTLRMLLRRSPRRRETALRRERLSEKKSGDLVRRHSLKDLFGSSPPGEEDKKTTSFWFRRLIAALTRVWVGRFMDLGRPDPVGRRVSLQVVIVEKSLAPSPPHHP